MIIFFDRPGSYQIQDISIHGTQAWHDTVQGAKRGGNIIYTLSVDGLAVYHLGDRGLLAVRGHLLSSEQISDIGKADILLLPVGADSPLR